jgi:hypothetical protein
VDQNSEAGKTLIIPLKLKYKAGRLASLFSLKRFHAKARRTQRAQRKGKEVGRLNYSFSFRVSFIVPTSLELQA